MNNFVVGLLCIAILIALAVGIIKVFGEFLHSKFMRKYVSERMYDVIMGVIVAQLFVAVITAPATAIIVQFLNHM